MSEGKSAGQPRIESEVIGDGTVAARSSKVAVVARTTDARTSATRTASASSPRGSP